MNKIKIFFRLMKKMREDRSRFNLMRASACRIQTTWRAHNARAKYCREKSSIIRCQSLVRWSIALVHLWRKSCWLMVDWLMERLLFKHNNTFTIYKHNLVWFIGERSYYKKHLACWSQYASPNFSSQYLLLTISMENSQRIYNRIIIYYSHRPLNYI